MMKKIKAVVTENNMTRKKRERQHKQSQARVGQASKTLRYAELSCCRKNYMWKYVNSWLLCWTNIFLKKDLVSLFLCCPAILCFLSCELFYHNFVVVNFGVVSPLHCCFTFAIFFSVVISFSHCCCFLIIMLCFAILSLSRCHCLSCYRCLKIRSLFWMYFFHFFVVVFPLHIFLTKSSLSHFPTVFSLLFCYSTLTFMFC